MKLPTWNESEKEYYKLLADALEKSWTGVIITNREGKAVYCNEAYSSVSGYTVEMLEATTMYDWKATSEENVSSSIAVFEQEKEIYLEQKSMITDKRCMIKAFPIHDDEGQVKYAVSHLLDITKLNELKKELDKEKLSLSQQNEEIERLLNLIGGDDEAKIVYKSQAMEKLMVAVSMISKSDATILISGESGTGKDLIARELHKNSYRADKPFMAINCSAIPENLLESELFGYEAGAFTGGHYKGKKGILKTANDGTIFLDEIGDMPLALQAKLLRTLQNREIHPLGARNPIKINVRFIAATNMDLMAEVKKKRFREDLYYRLSVVPLHVPPLRKRPEDIPLLAHYFMKYYNIKYSKSKILTGDAIQLLYRKSFPGNVRQLKNLIEHAYLITASNVIDASILKSIYEKQNKNFESPQIDFISPQVSSQGTLQEMLEEYEKSILKDYRKKFKSTYKMADALGTNQSTIARKLHKYHIE